LRKLPAASVAAEVFADALRLIGSDSVDANVIASLDSSRYGQVSASWAMNLRNEQAVRLVIISVNPE